MIDYSVVPTGFGKSKLVGVKAYTFERKWIINNGKTLTTKEEIETKETTDIFVTDETINTLVEALPTYVKIEYEKLYSCETDNKAKYDWLNWKIGKLKINSLSK